MNQEDDDDVFIIPERDEDLQMERDGQYSVRFVEDLQISIEQFREFVQKCRDEPADVELVFRYFDYLYVLVKRPANADEDEVKDLRIFVDLAMALVVGIEKVQQLIVEGLPFLIRPNSEMLQQEEAQQALRGRKSLLMHIYLLWRVNTRLEQAWLKWSAQRRLQQSKARGRGRGRKPTVDDEAEDEPMDMTGEVPDEWKGMEQWADVRYAILNHLVLLLSQEIVDPQHGNKVRHAIRFLWPQGVADKMFLRTVSRIFLEWLENEDHRFKQNVWLVQICRLLVPLALGFGQSDVLGALILEKTIHLAWIKDNFPFIEAIQRQTLDPEKPELYEDVAGKKNALDNVLSSMLVQMAMIRPQELTSANHNTTRALVCFVQTISSRAPQIMLKNIASIMPFLQEDPHQLRGAVLTALAELVMSNELSDEKCKLNSMLRDNRATFMDILQRHLRDQATQVRAKVVNLWRLLADAKRIPSSVVDNGIIDYIGERLEDKQVLVRKPAIAFMSSFLKNNVYGHDFSWKANTSHLQKLLAEREALVANDPDFDPQRRAEAYVERHHDLVKSNLVTGFATVDWGSHEEPLDEDDDFSDDVIAGWPAFLFQAAAGSGDFHDLIGSIVRLLKLGVFKELGWDLADYNMEDPTEQNKLVDVIMEYACDRCMKERLISENMLPTNDMLKEERRADWLDKLRKCNDSIAYMQTKLHAASALSDSLQSALRGALHGDAAELKEAINFIIECKNFEICDSDKVIRQVFALIWRNNIDIQKEVVNAARKMLISQNEQSDVADPATARKMLQVLKGTKKVEYNCVSEVIERMLRQYPDDVGSGVTDYLTMVIGAKRKKKINKEEEEKNIGQAEALQLLEIFSRVHPQKVRTCLRELQEFIAKGSRHSDDPMQVRKAALAIPVIIHSAQEDRPVDEKEAKDIIRLRESSCRIPYNDGLWATLETFCVERFLDMDYDEFATVLRDTFTCQFNVCAQPGRACSQLIGTMIWYCQRASKVLTFYEAEHSKMSKKNDTSSAKAKLVWAKLDHFRLLQDKLLERTMYASGELAQHIHIYVDQTFTRELKRMQKIIDSDGRTTQSLSLEEYVDMQKKVRIKGGKRPTDDQLAREYEEPETGIPQMPVRVLLPWEADSARRQGIFEIFHDKVLKANDANDQEFSIAIDVANAQLMQQLHPSFILARVVPLVTYCIRAKGTSDKTRCQASTALAKMVPLCRHFAKKSSFLITLLMTAASDPTIRENLLVAMADIYEFVPIPFDNYQSELFNMCRDVDPLVRETALLVLLHVTTDGLVQNRSGVADVARCFVDTSQDVQAMARVFFQEFATKKNMVFNAMPDFLSRLTRNPKQIPFPAFQLIMTPLLEYLEPAENDDMVVRVVQRLEALDEESLERNELMPLYFVWVLNMVSKSEKSFSKIREHRKAVERFLHIPGFYDHLHTTLEQLKKVASPNAHYKTDVEQFIEETKQLYEKAVDHEITMKKASAFQKRARGQSGPKTTGSAKKETASNARGAGRRRVYLDEIEEDDEDAQPKTIDSDDSDD